jgi:NADPH2:quinone reductase
MPHAIQIRQTGGPEVLNWTPIEVGEPGSGQVRLRQAAAGLNYIDVYHRTGYYPQPLPFIPGLEGAGTVEAIGQDVLGLKVGDRVAYAGPVGGHSEVRLIEADRLVRKTGAKDWCERLVRKTGAKDWCERLVRKTGAKDWCERLVRSTGAIARCDLLRSSSRDDAPGYDRSGADPAGLSRQGGWLDPRAHRSRRDRAHSLSVGGRSRCDGHWHRFDRSQGRIGPRPRCKHTIVYSKQDFVAEVSRISGGEKLPVVFDSVGKDTFLCSLDCLRSRGLMVTFGQASGPIDPIAPVLLSQKGSLFLTRPSLFHYIARREELEASTNALFMWWLRERCALTSISALRSRMPLTPTTHWKRAQPRAPPF